MADIPVCMISYPQEFSLCSIKQNLQIRNQVWANDKNYSGRSNESDLQESSCDLSALIAHSANSAQCDIGKHLAEWNRRNEVTTNYKRSAIPHPMGAHPHS